MDLEDKKILDRAIQSIDISLEYLYYFSLKTNIDRKLFNDLLRRQIINTINLVEQDYFIDTDGSLVTPDHFPHITEALLK